jgi:hypothetical protein
VSGWDAAQEAAHPREPKGHKGGGEWVHHVLAQLTHDSRAVAGDITGRLDYEHLGKIRDYEHGDAQLSEIYQQQGFHGKPRVVTRQEMDDLIVQHGWKMLHRGINHHDPAQADAWAEEFRSGDRQYAGLGAFGNGTYTSVDRHTAENYGARRGGVDSERAGMLRIALNPDARVITTTELNAMMQADQDREEAKSLEALGDTPAKRAEYFRQHAIRRQVLADEGRYAAAHGYDAIKAANGNVYVILNRSAVAVEEAQ